MRLRLLLAYDGRAFAGWQSQPGGNTVQDVLEAAIGRILHATSPPRIHGAGRTDAGVHALGQVAHFDAPDSCRMTPENWLRALNAHLPPALRVFECLETRPDFHARFQASGKIYHYRIFTGPVLPPLEAGVAWHVPQSLDLSRLQTAARAFAGRHDFAAFCAFRGEEDEKEPGYATRTLWSVEPSQTQDVLTLTFHGEGFLYKMVRLMTGSMIRVARGSDSVEWLLDLLTRPNGRKSPYAAPADGLYLAKVDYPKS